MFDQVALDVAIYLVAGILMLAVLLARMSSRFGIPGLIVFLGLGILFGSDVLGIVAFDNAYLARLISTSALIIVLFEGGLKTEFTLVRKVALPSASLATLGVVVTSFIMGYAAHLVLGLPLMEGLLVGAIVGSTDAAAVFSVIGPQRIRQRVKSTLEAESGANDPMAVFLTILAINVIMGAAPSAWSLAGQLLWQGAVGLGLGVGLGRFVVWFVSRYDVGDDDSLYQAFFLGSAFLVYSMVSALNASGILAVYVYGIVVGNNAFPLSGQVVRFHEGLSWLAQVVLFALLGLLVFPNQLVDIVVPGLILAAIMILVARPPAVWLATLGMGFNTRERLFLSWAGLKGAVPVILATYPFLVNYEHSALIFNTVFFVVLVSALVQGTTIASAARLLGLDEGKAHSPVHTLELTSLRTVNTELVEYHVTQDCHAVGRMLRDLSLPKTVTVAAISRGDQVVIPRGSTSLAQGDFLFVLTPVDEVAHVQEILANGDGEPDEKTPDEKEFGSVEEKEVERRERRNE